MNIGKLIRDILRNIVPLPVRRAIRASIEFCLVNFIHNPYNYILRLNTKRLGYDQSELKQLNDIRKQALKLTDMSDYLEILFIESLIINPSLIVELGVGIGESTFSLERVANICGSTLISVDINDCSKISSYENWVFVQKDDWEFAQEFPNWCKERNIDPRIDVLFIDTGHAFDHTLKEIHSWFPFLSDNSKVFLHDTNLRKIYFRKDGSMGIGWDNERGVIRALEVHFQKSFNERQSFTDIKDGWLIRHDPYCCGLAILQKIDYDFSRWPRC